ncbi:Nuc-1 negative regulatory protein preg [Penicillium chermesinum]|uniref:Nuc-1 negative regulatory protein preg n=1 Tax=Penicillium chermesinum TaxID=63820 RepID=A0A9W9NBQ2_9EURO|nr:Nuc-1 negative regulatory protein preg [Penicillium chermesinum]KAJ5216922.1 Nuc-1 negative regulatory protein preg [Penicillium chermesinum]KAJ6171466.1 Nuc-1 negative regulatory protein preg [Penicillium chermesinum]
MLASSPSPSSTALRSGAVPHRYEHSTPQFNSPRSSRLAIEELRSALNRHTVDPASPASPNLRRRASASTSATAAASYNPAPSTHPVSSQHPSVTPSAISTATPLGSIPTPTTASAANPADPPSAASPSSMPAPDASGSNKRNSRSDDHPAEANSADQGEKDVETSQTKRLRPAQPEVKVLPEQYELADTRDLVLLISSMLMELIRFNDKIPLNQSRLTRFHSRSPPRISVQDYLQRLTTHATLSPPILLSMVFYIDRLCALYPAFTVSSLTIHRFLIVSATVASKGLSDSFWTNKTYARVGGISMAELAMLEMEFLFRVQWRIVPEPEVLVDYYRSLVERCDNFEIARSSSVPTTNPTPAATTPAA